MASMPRSEKYSHCELNLDSGAKVQPMRTKRDRKDGPTHQGVDMQWTIRDDAGEDFTVKTW